jgi:hypothetical protein
MNDFMLAEARQIFDLQTWQLRQNWYGVYCQCKNSDIFKQQVSQNVQIVTGIGGKGMTGSPGFSEQIIEEMF